MFHIEGTVLKKIEIWKAEDYDRLCEAMGDGLYCVRIPDGITEVSGYAFDGKSHIGTIIVPSSIEIMRSRCILDCENLKSVVFEEDFHGIIEGHCVCACNDFLEQYAGKQDIIIAGNLVKCRGKRDKLIIDAKEVKYVSSFALSDVEVETLVIKGNVHFAEKAAAGAKIRKILYEDASVISKGAFRECEGLKKVVFSPELDVLEEDAFMRYFYEYIEYDKPQPKPYTFCYTSYEVPNIDIYIPEKFFLQKGLSVIEEAFSKRIITETPSQMMGPFRKREVNSGDFTIYSLEDGRKLS